MNRIAKNIVTLAATAALALTSAAALAAAPLQLGVPDDGTNLSRGIKLLEAAGFIEVDPAAGYTPEIKDITKYLYNVEVTPIAANTLPSTLGDFAASTINGTYAVPYGLIPSRDALLIEKQDENGENPYVNVVVARTADKDSEVYKKVVEAYQTQLVAEFLLVNYHETFFPAFPYDEGATFAVTEDNVSEISGYKSSKEGKTVVKIGVCGGVSNNEQWIATQKVLDDEGANIYIELVEFDAYNLPNEALNSGDIDLNAFQHQIYLDNEVEQQGYKIQSIGYTFIIPLNIYSHKVKAISDIKDGDVVAIPDDVTNGGRAIKVLAAAGLITLKQDAGFNPTLEDIETYNTKITIKELKANTIPSVLDDVTAAVVNGNYALDFGLKTEEAIYKDSVLDEAKYWNLIAARTEDLQDADKVAVYQKVVKAFQSDATEKVFNDTFGGYFIKVGWDQDLLASK